MDDSTQRLKIKKKFTKMSKIPVSIFLNSKTDTGFFKTLLKMKPKVILVIF